MKTKKLIIALSILLVVVLYIGLYSNGNMGVSRNRLEKDARKSQEIDATWLVTKDVTDKMGALLFYNKELNQHTFSVYLKRDGFSYGYFFGEGGSLSSSGSEVQGFSYQDKGMALISMNTKNVEEITLNDGQNIERIKINPLEPFAIIIPHNVDVVQLYDSNGKSISIDNIWAY
ncbi:hypothetical protein EDC19_1822 [Natranaerovirga hydrolytica]|uniref:Uncharacterized protein n=1 Tax=Natranaerovirga hydrolytica TaxID=680378 RepID=A0A4R1MQ73_9FIRM|nr:hypothetical protein [Natranaerovirga hydrolytica]TCK92669.1 hypothetical protein EDC19_1822 [Natranaerovirga hydrolytica]